MQENLTSIFVLNFSLTCTGSDYAKG